MFSLDTTYLISEMSVSMSGSKIEENTYQNSLESFMKKTHENIDWFEKNINEMFPLINV